eukprot:scaffold73082_cov36-Cyclotella_meneghiniana.AAC.2
MPTRRQNPQAYLPPGLANRLDRGSRRQAVSFFYLFFTSIHTIVDRRVVASFLACDYRRGQAGVVFGRQLPVDRHAGGRFFDD